MIPLVDVGGELDRPPQILSFPGKGDPSRALLYRFPTLRATRLLHGRRVFDVRERFLAPFRHAPRDLVTDALAREHGSCVAE